MRPLISVVMCTWNGEKFVEQQIRSILDQSYSPIELLISDDASTDNTPSILQKFQSDERVTIIHQPVNIGLSKNYNLVLGKVKGEFIACSDQDDIWLSQKIESLYRDIGNELLIYSNSLLVHENGYSMGRTTADIRRMYTGSDSRGYVMHSVVWGHAMMIRKELLQEALPIPEGIHHDDWLAFRALSLKGIKYHDEVLTHYRQHASSTTKTVAVHQPTRSRSIRSLDAEKKLQWYELMKENCSNDLKQFYNRLCELYKRKFSGHFVWPLFFFLLSHRKEIFRFSKKNFFSHFIEILKQARGEESIRS